MTQAEYHTEQKHLDLIALVLLVLQELVVNGSISGIALLLFGTRATAHVD